MDGKWESFYLEKKRRLPIECQEIHSRFMKGSFVVKSLKRDFKGVSPNMKLEQKIQKSKRSAAGIMGQTCQVS